jgi:hypothetical protein
MNTSHIGGTFAQERKTIKKKRGEKKDSAAESNLDSKNTLNEVSERDDSTSMASGRTGSKNTINIQVALSHQASNVGGSSGFKRINSN